MLPLVENGQHGACIQQSNSMRNNNLILTYNSVRSVWLRLPVATLRDRVRDKSDPKMLEL